MANYYTDHPEIEFHLNHKATTCCMVIANRRAQKADTGYKSHIDDLIKTVLDRI